MRARALGFAAGAALALFAAACGKQPAAPTAAPAQPASPAAAPTPEQQADAMAHQHADDAPLPSPAVLTPPPAGTVDSRTISYGSVDGKPVKGYFARPGTGDATTQAGLPAVILFHEWWGLNENMRGMADLLAARGYLVLATDMYGGQVAETPDAARQLMRNALAKPKLLDQNISAAYDWLKKEQKAGKVGTVGWCFGGTMSFEAAQLLSNRLGAAVIYYGFVNDRKDELARIKAPVLGLFGGQDESIPASTVEGFRKTLEAQGARPIIRIYPEAGHAFANPSGRNFRREDAEDAWRRTLDFLGENLTS